MARRTVSFTEGSFYHIYNRGVGRQEIFRSNDNYSFVMRKVVDKNQYLGHLCWYIHMNPVSAGMVRDLEEWPYSNYLECVAKRNLWAFDGELIADFFGSPSGYEEFVRSYVVTAKQDEKLKEYFLDE